MLQNSDNKYFEFAEFERLDGFLVDENFDYLSDESPGECFLDRYLVDYSVNLLLLIVRISLPSHDMSQET